MAGRASCPWAALVDKGQLVLWTLEGRRHLRLPVVHERPGQPADWQVSGLQQERFRVKLLLGSLGQLVGQKRWPPGFCHSSLYMLVSPASQTLGRVALWLNSTRD